MIVVHMENPQPAEYHDKKFDTVRHTIDKGRGEGLETHVSHVIYPYCNVHVSANALIYVHASVAHTSPMNRSS